MVSQLRRYPHVETPAAKEKIMECIKTAHMAPYYEKVCATLGWDVDQKLLKELQQRNEDDLKKIEEKLEDAKENLGETEVKDFLVQKAVYYTRIGDREKSFEAYEVAYPKIVGVGGKMDVLLTRLRLGFFFDDLHLIKINLDLCKEELQKGGDWERKNKLKVYEALFLVHTREFTRAATLFHESTATFTASELMSMKNFILYCVITSMCGMNRADLRSKIVNNPEILSVIGEWPELKEFLHAYFYCKYSDFMRHFVGVMDLLRTDHYLDRQLKYVMRVLRLNAFRQFLASYKSVTIDAMARAFNVSSNFIDTEVSSFISNAKLPCKIDKVGGIIESNTADTRNTKYLEILKQGDLLLNRMQKVAATVDC